MRGANSNITVLNVVTAVNCGTTFGQAPGLESDGTEELRMPECVRIADRHEHTVEFALEKFHTTLPPAVGWPTGRRMICQTPLE